MDVDFRWTSRSKRKTVDSSESPQKSSPILIQPKGGPYSPPTTFR
jgi:hypothetical protein